MVNQFPVLLILQLCEFFWTADKLVNHSFEYAFEVADDKGLLAWFLVVACGVEREERIMIIGAGSVVTKDIPDGVVAAGVPCKPIGKFENYKAKLME